MKQIPPEEERFASNAVTMANAVHFGIQKLYNDGYKVINPSSILLASAVIEGFDKEQLIKSFIINSHENCWDKIKERDEVYFVENVASVFKYLPSDSVNLFKDLFLTKDHYGECVVPLTLKNQIWELFDAMIRISIKYIHKHRLINKLDFFKEVDLEHHSKTWNVILKYI